MGIPVTFRALGPDTWAWVSSRTRTVWCTDTKGIVAFRGDKIVGAVICDNWSHNAVSLHWSIEDPMLLRHGFLEEVAEYVFLTSGRGLMVGMVPSDNPASLKLTKHIGFTETYRIKDGYKIGVDSVIHEMRKEDCRWLKASDRMAA